MTILKSNLEHDRVQRIHFVGIGGSGMSGIAEVLLNSGYEVSGSDVNDNTITRRLSQLGMTIFKGHAANNIKKADILVISSAILSDNPELIAAQAERIPIIPRAQMLAELMRDRYGIAIAGTHGKTTTTSLVTSILAEGGLDPTFVIGGLLNSAGTNARLGASEYLVAEADESDASFLYLKSRITVITNIDMDHVWAYENKFLNIRRTFIEFLHHLPLSGLAILCIDDPMVQAILAEVARPMLTYGFSKDADIRATDFRQQGIQTFFTAYLPGAGKIDISLNMPGRHNVLNALAAIAVAKEVGVSDAAIQRSLMNFQGVGRRFQILGKLTFKNGHALLIDDYGHHPREIAVTVAAIRLAWPNRRVVVAFQPHRYSRTVSLFEDFAKVLADVDRLLLLDVYSAGEKPIAGADGRSLCRAIRQRGRVEPVFIARDQRLEDVLQDIIKADDILLLQGAGDVGAMALNLAKNNKR